MRLCFQLFLLVSLSSGYLFADSLDVMFRYDDSPRQYARTYLPGDFNNWASNNNGVIAVNSPTAMAYNVVFGSWTKKARLSIGSTHYYKIYLSSDSAGVNHQWISDPLNPLLDNSGYGNSQLLITDPMIFEPVQSKGGDGSITGITVNLLTSKGFLSVKIIVDADSTEVSSSRDSSTGVLSYTFPSAVPTTSSMALYVRDAIGRTLTYFFHHDSLTVVHPNVPDWAKDVVWYQIFPERFRNSDHSNDPVRTSLENPQYDPTTWRVSPWTGDWYSQDTWEIQKGGGFYSTVFDRRYGGDLQGVVDELGYLDSLGINAIYFNPIFYARSLHKYDGTAMHHVDPYFGPNPAGDIALIQSETLDSTTWHWTQADTLFLGLLREAHRRGMKVILDGVWDHTGVSFYAFNDIVTKGVASAYTSWYTIYSFSPLSYRGWYGISSLPEFAQTPDGTNMAPGPKQYIFTVTRRWMDPNGDGDPSDGIDGWRLDTVPDIPLGFWADWNTLVQQENHNACTISEVWTDASMYINKGGFSGTMNYYGCGIPIYSFLTGGEITASQYGSQIANNFTIYGNDPALDNQNLVDSHDTERLMSMIINAPIATGFQTVDNPNASSSYAVRAPNTSERKLQKLIVFAQMTSVGAPMVYYGDEAGMWGATDPDDRKPMPWPDLSMSPEATDPRGYSRTPDNTNFNATVHAYYQKAIALRHDHPALRRGDFIQLEADDAAKTLAYSRSYDGETVLSVINRSSQAQKINIPVTSLPYHTLNSFTALFTSDSTLSAITMSLSNDTLSVNLPPVTGALILNSPTSVQSISVNRGWNIVSLPVQVVSASPGTLFPNALGGPYYYDSLGYHSTDSMAAGTGYWLKFDSTSSFNISGLPFQSTDVKVTAGWNLVGAFGAQASVPGVSSTPSGIIISAFFGYNAGYGSIATLQPGKGYWVKVSQAGTLHLNSPNKR